MVDLRFKEKIRQESPAESGGGIGGCSLSHSFAQLFTLRRQLVNELQYDIILYETKPA